MTRNMTVVVSSMALMALASCGEKKADTALTGDSALGRDLAMAQQDSAAQPKLEDVPAAPAPTAEPAPAAAKPAPKPAPKPAAPKPSAPAASPKPTPAAAPITGTVAAGTSLRFTSNSKVCSNTAPTGEKFTATLSDAVNARRERSK
jgi:outer membrane biosynthesis protein TonB